MQPFYNDQNTEGQDALVQFTVDDNFFNSLMSVLLTLDEPPFSTEATAT
jgi:hypothetical protein